MRRVALTLAAAFAACSRSPHVTVPDAGPAGAALRREVGIIDWHEHIEPDAMERADALLDAEGITEICNLSGGSPGHGLEEQLAAALRSRHKVHVFAVLDMREARRGPGYGARLAAQLEASARMGAVGWKIPKGLGIGYRDVNGALIPVDDPELDVVFERAGELGLPVAIHTADPKAFWLPPTVVNERYAELGAHPGWSFYGTDVKPWSELLDQLERRVARHPHTTIVALHFGGAPEEPDRVARMLDKYPNLYIDTAARVPEIGRHDAQKMHDFFIKYQDRILFGTDLGVGAADEDLMLGSTGPKPPGPAEIRLFFDATWRYFETSDRQFAHPTPIQGNWKIDGIALPPEVLRKLYHDNAARLLNHENQLTPKTP
jgi:predicted TIM-barrel fold metal-dependent hydrolase